jgi:hypothetical protein
MQLDLYKTLWGHEGTVEQGALLAIDAGFTGIEAPAPADEADQEHMATMFADHGLSYIAEICTTGSYVPDRHATPDEHLASLETKIKHSLMLSPRFCNVMGGCDAWPMDVQVDFFRRAQDMADRYGVLCSFETHRSRSFFNPWITRDVLRALPDLLITCDFSHWVVVCERQMDSEWETILEVAEKAHHVHSRVGYDQGPQVPHPAAPEYAEALASHERSWQAIWASQVRRGYTASSMTPEFGPDGYLHTQPFTGMPVADLWQMNRWVGLRERDQFGLWQAAQQERVAG